MTDIVSRHPGPPVPVPYSYGKPKRRLSRKTRAAEWLMTSGEFSAVYPNAIEVPGFIAGTAKGMGVFMGLFAIVATSFGWYMGFLALTDGRGDAWFSVLFILFGAVALGFAITFFRLDLFAYRDEPVLFNRKTRKVHVFRRRVQMSKPWRPWPLVIDTYDWDRITGEIHGGLRLFGQVPQTRYRLLAAVSDQPTGRGRKAEVIDRFVIGAEMPSDTMCISRWEQIRRYMEEDGPPLRAGDRLDKPRFLHRDALARGGLWALETGFYDDFKTRPGPKIAGTLLTVLLSPLFGFMAIFRWLAEVTSRAPWWPAEILEAAGGAPLLEAEVHAQADELKRAQEQIEEAAMTVEQRQQHAYVKAKAEEPFWTPERRKYGVLLLSLGVLFGIGKAVQFWLRGY